MESKRRAMVETQLAARAIRDEAVLDALGKVPRECFVPAALRDLAYEDQPLAIGNGQTISQPYMVAVMLQAANLKSGQRVLDVGTGSGYAAAVAAEMGTKVFSIERDADLAFRARHRFDDLGLDITTCVGDGSAGWQEHAPYDVILVAAAAGEVPDALTSQLAEGGRLLIPVGSILMGQHLLRLTRSVSGIEKESLAMVSFVPLVSD
ncbi:hypothetical protein FP2506_05811 [Fulvimarina pelagi HTCC2506]|uniref:Protein-L-isoaspartate O-methyltransferase n=1 Tax=Fulvimarina pelagi HTCC2506 TaxID=314231 RepID=Q0G7N4_9HYPH|nr:protein-L-isoaspartate(D-aspartate) O-methyltransferase [Fulvimarina pelagi]EAU42330.1 hypothetical protein FP2506_05811 [Fulvimarina pelagi HTCC2506]